MNSMNPSEWNDMLLSELGLDFTRRAPVERRKPVALKVGRKMKIVKPSRFLKVSFEGDGGASDTSVDSRADSSDGDDDVTIPPSSPVVDVLGTESEVSSSEDEDDPEAEETEEEADPAASPEAASPEAAGPGGTPETAGRVPDVVDDRLTLRDDVLSYKDFIEFFKEKGDHLFGETIWDDADPEQEGISFKEGEDSKAYMEGIIKQTGFKIKSDKLPLQKYQALEIVHNRLLSLNYSEADIKDIIQHFVFEGKKQPSFKSMIKRVAKIPSLPERARLPALFEKQTATASSSKAAAPVAEKSPPEQSAKSPSSKTAQSPAKRITEAVKNFVKNPLK